MIEMMIVLLIISILILLFVPNLSKEKDKVNDKGNEAVVKVVETQIELYQMEKPGVDTEKALDEITEDGKITQKQHDIYVAHKDDKPDDDK